MLIYAEIVCGEINRAIDKGSIRGNWDPPFEKESIP